MGSGKKTDNLCVSKLPSFFFSFASKKRFPLRVGIRLIRYKKGTDLLTSMRRIHDKWNVCRWNWIKKRRVKGWIHGEGVGRGGGSNPFSSPSLFSSFLHRSSPISVLPTPPIYPPSLLLHPPLPLSTSSRFPFSSPLPHTPFPIHISPTLPLRPPPSPPYTLLPWPFLPTSPPPHRPKPRGWGVGEQVPHPGCWPFRLWCECRSIYSSAISCTTFLFFFLSF